MNLLTEHSAAEITAQELANLDPVKCREYIDEVVDLGIDAGEDPGVERINLRCERDTQFFALVYLAETFDQAMTYQHDAVWKLMDDDTLPKVCTCAWRGFGKTSMLFAKCVKMLVFRQTKFIMYVGATHDYAAEQTEDIKLELLTNPRIVHIFGSLKARNYEGVDLRFSKKAWFVCDPITGEPLAFVLPRGANQRVRGANIRIQGRKQRPTFIAIDDLEDDEDVLNEDTRRKTRRWFAGALLPCVPRVRPNPSNDLWDKPENDPDWTPPWRVFYQDTLKHEDANIAHVMNGSDWKSKTYPQAHLVKREDGTSTYVSLVPEIISDRQVRREVANAKKDHAFDEYCREKLCLAIPPEGAAWTKEMFRYYDDAKSGMQINPDVDRFIIVDPAKTANTKSDFTAILGVGANVKTGKVHFRKQINKHLGPQEILDATFDMAVALNSKVIAVEITGLDDWVKFNYKNEATRRRLDVEFVWLKGQNVPKGDFGTGRDAAKRARASMIIPFYQRGVVYHDESLRDGPLEMQQLSFPKPAKWDALDCAGYVPLVLEHGGRYFQPQIVEDQELPGFEDDPDYEALGRRIHARDWALS